MGRRGGSFRRRMRGAESWKQRPGLRAVGPMDWSREESGGVVYGDCVDHAEGCGRVDRWTTKRKRRLNDQLESLLLMCQCSEFEPGSELPPSQVCRVPPIAFGEPCLVNTEIDRLYSGWSFASARPADLPHGFDESTCSYHPVLQLPSDAPWILHRLRSVPVSAARGYRLASPYVGQLDTCHLSENGTYVTTTALVNWSPADRWSRLDDGYRDREAHRTDSVCKVLLGVAFSRQMIWQVVFRFEAMSLAVFCDQVAAARLFSDRDVEDGRSRRVALRHWVRDHLRRNPRNDDELIEVVRHMRGRVPFVWRGIDCELVPSADDEATAIRLKEQKALRQ